jgi:polysaccharide biosynthesis protein PslH
MRVLQICNKAPFPPNDGSSIAIYNMGTGFISNGVELHVLTINTKKHFKPDDQVPQDYRKKSNYRSVYENTDVSLTGALANLFSSQSYFVSRFYFKDFENALIEKLKANTFDIIQLEGLFVATYIPVIKKFSKAKIVLRAHNVEYLIWERHLKNERSALKKWYLGLQTKRLKHFELQCFNSLDAIVTITDYDKSVFEKEGFQKPVYTCITGVDVSLYRQKKSEKVKPKSIFHFASMDWMPNQEAVQWFLENCWRDIVKEVPEVKLVLAGRYMPRQLLDLKHPNIEVVEKVDNSAVFYNEHEIMLVPLLSGSGLRIKIIEGLAYGKAIVSTSVGAEGINYTNEKNILIANSPQDFSKSVITLLKDSQRRKELEQGALEFAERELDNAKVVSGLIGFYKKLINA